MTALWLESAAAAFEPARDDTFARLGYEPTPKQRIFHDATEWDVLFGGAAGGGKSRAITAEVIRTCMKYPGIKVGAFRRTFGELRESIIGELAKMDFAKALGATWNGSDYELRFPNNSVAMFRYAESVKDATRRQGGEYQLLVFDERTLTPPSVCEFLETRLRSGRPDVPVLGIRSTANPGGVGHGSVKARYIKPTNYGERTVTDKRGRVTRFIPSKLSDNPHMNAEYGSDLSAFPADMRAAFMDGNWDLVSGAMFPELGQRERYVVAPFTLPSSWMRYCGIDWGFFPGYWAVIWGAIDEDGRIWLYREKYAQRVGETEQARQILEAEAPGERIAVRFADDAMWAGRGEARSSADMYASEGVYLTKAEKGARVIGWQRVGTYLSEKPACQHHRALGWDTCPMLHMFPALEDTFRTLADIQHATKGDPEDANSSGEDHLPDALRYMLINLGTGPDFPILGEVPGPGLAEKLQNFGQFAVRPPDDSAPWHDSDDDEPRATVQRSPWG